MKELFHWKELIIQGNIMLSQTHAQALVDAIQDHHKAAKSTPSITIDGTRPIDVKTLVIDDEKGSLDSFEKNLESLRKQIIDRESYVLHLDDAKQDLKMTVRVFPPKDKNIFLDKYHVLGRGIDTARAVVEILKYEKPQNPEKLAILKKAFFALQTAIIEDNVQPNNDNLSKNSKKSESKSKMHDTMRSASMAKMMLKHFNGVMCALLSKHSELCASTHQAEAAINFVRDFIWKRTWQQEAFCTEIPNKNNDLKGDMVLRYAQPMTIRQTDPELISKDKKSEAKLKHPSPLSWETALKKDAAKPAWYTSLQKELGNWFNDFSVANQKKLDTLSVTPMSRSTPNPANAYDSCLISINKNSESEKKSADKKWEATVDLHGVHTAITEPFEVEDEKERITMTTEIHRNIILGPEGERLKNIIRRHFNAWKGIDDKATVKEVEIPILHQTLIGDNILPSILAKLVPDTKKSTTVLDNREIANEALRQELLQYNIYRHRTGEITFHLKDEKDQPTPPSAILIKPKILETNNCINAHHKYSRVRNKDVNDSRELISIAATQLAKLREIKISPDQQKNVSTIIDFLNSRDHSFFTPYKSRGDAVKNAVKSLTDYLLDNNLGIDKQTQKNFALLAQSAIELKCTVHETWLGSARRIYNNILTTINIPLISPLLKFAGWVVGNVLKLLTFPINVFTWAQHTRRKMVHKAVNEAIVAELLGERFGGCMSSADRGEEIEQRKQAQLRAFNHRRRILGFNDGTNAVLEFRKLYDTTQEKHNFNLMSTGSPATSDAETRGFGDSGLASQAEAPVEQSFIKDMQHLRKGEYKHKGISLQKYAVITPATPTEQGSPGSNHSDSSPKTDSPDSKSRRM